MNPFSAVRHVLAACLPSSRTALPLIAVSTALLLAVRLAATTQGVSIGDLVVADAGTSAGTAALIQVAPGTGTKTTLSGTGASIDTVRIVTPASASAVYYYETLDSTNAGKIVLFNPSTGVRSVVPGSAFTAVTDMAWNSLTSRLLVADAGISAGTAVIYSVDPTTGTRTTLTGNGTGSGATLDIPRHLTCSPAGAIYYSESQDSTNVGKIVSVVPATGVRTVVPGNAFTAISALNWDAINAKLIVSDAGTSSSTAAIYRVDPATGTRTTLTGNGTGSGATLDTPRYAATASTGAIYYYESADSTNAGKVVSVVPATGVRTALAGTAYTAVTALSVVPSSLPSPSGLGSPASVTAANTLSYTVPAGNNRLLVVTASHPDNGGKTLTSVAFGAQTLTQAVISTDGAAAIDSIWTLPLGSSASPTTATITVTRNAEASTRPCSFISAQTFKDVHQTSSIQTVSTANVSGGLANSTLTIASSASDTLFDLFDIFSSSASLAATVGGGQTPVSNSGAYEIKNAGVSTYAGYGLWATSTKPGSGATTATAWTSNATAYLSAAISLKQAPASSAPTITSPTKAAISGTTATLGANITADGGTAITKRGILYARTTDNNNPTVGGTNVTEVDDSTLTTGVFTAAVTSLAPSTGYSYVGFAVTSAGTSYTSVDTFTTATVLSSIVVTPANPSIARGTTQQFIATGTYSDTSSQNLTGMVTWSSGTTANATIDTAGLATGAGVGTSTITATSGSVSGSTTLTVTAPTITLAPTSLTNPAIGTATSQSVTASGGTSTYTYAVTAGSLPAGLTLAANGSLTGTATAAGTFNFTVTATDSSTGTSAPFTGSRAYSLTVGAPTITVAPTSLTNLSVGASTNQSVTASGGTASYTYAVTAGALPAGLSFATNGTLSGTPTTAGTFNFTVTATDSSTGTGAPFTGSRAYSLTVGAPTITLAPTTLTAATVATATSQTITASGGTASYTYAVTAGSLPAGLTLATNGALTGTPTAGGTFNFTVTATDSSIGTGAPFTGSRAYSLSVGAPTITLAPTTLTAATVATATSQSVTASGGTGSYTYAVTAGALPSGLTLATNGTLSGTPIAGGTFNFTVTATDSSTGSGPFTGSRAYSLTVNTPSIAVSPTTLTAATVATATSQTITASGGTATYTYAVTAGALPAGLTLGTDGTLSGTPTAGGTFNFTVTATDSSTGSGPFTGSRAYSLTVSAPSISLSPSTALPDSAANQSYSHTVAAIGGTAPYIFEITAGASPTGLTLASAGTLSGTPTVGGTFNFTITATDSSTGSGPFTGSRSYAITISTAPTVTSPASADVTGNAATLGGTVASDGASALTAAGVVLSPTGINSEPRLGGTGVLTFSGVTTATPYPLSVPVSGLALGTTYSYAAYATNAVGTGYSATGTFTTGTTGSLVDTLQTDFQAGVATNLDVTASPGDVTLKAAGQMDQSNTAGTTTGTTLGATNWAGQTFTAAISGPLTKVDVTFFINGSANAGPDLTLSVRATSGGLPTGADLAAGTIPGFSDSAGNVTATVNFASPITLTAGQQYALILRPVSTPSGSGYFWIRSSPSTYAGGQRVITADSGGSWTADATRDFNFKTYVGSGFATSGDFVSSLKDSNLPAGKTHWTTLSWTATTPENTSVKFQVAASDAVDGTFTFVGPDGTDSTYFTESGASLAQFYGHRYLQYRAFLATTDTAITPTLSDVTVAYDLVAPPVVSATDATEITGISATLGGNVTFDGGGVITARGIVISATADNASPTLGGTGVTTIAATTNDVGLYTVSATGLANGTGYSYAAYATNEGGTTYSDVATFTTVAPPVVTNATLTASGTYGSVFDNYTVTATNTPSSYAADGLPAGLTISADTGVISGTPTDTGVFNVTLGATNVAGTGNATLVLTVAKVTLTVTADAKTKVYGSANPTATATITGFVLDQTLATSDVTGTPGLSIAADLTTAVGSATITPSLGNLASSHYDFTFVNGALSITKYPLTVTADAKTRLYGAANPTLTATISGFLNGQNLGTSGVTGSANVTTSAVGNTPVGPATITAAAGTLSAPNYSFTFAPGTLTITKAPLTVTADAKTKVYGAAVPALTATISGFANSESLGTSGVTGTATVTTTADTTTAVGSATLTPALGSLVSTNYAFTTFTEGTLTITKAPLTVTADAKTKVYGSANPALTATITGYVLGQNAGTSGVAGAPVLATAADATTAVGSPAITVALGTLAADNYSFTLVDGTLSITKAPLTVTADAKSKVYGAANPSFTATYTGFVNGQNFGTSGITGAPTLTTTATPASPVASYPITAAVGTLVSANYSFTFVNGSLSVTRAELLVTANPKTRTYGAADPAFTATITGYVNSDTLSVVSGAPAFSTNASATSPIGNYVITPALGTLAADNYTFTYGTGALTITRATLTLAVNAATKAYGDDNPVLTTRYVGFLNNETDTVVSGAPVLSTTAVKSSPVGNYPITVTAGTLSAANYAFNTTSVFSSNILTVTKAPLTVRVTNQTRAYGAANATPVATYSGFVLGETVSVVSGAPVLAHTATLASPVGAYDITITAGTLTATNYSFSVVSGTLTVTQASLTVTADAKTKAYGADNPALTATITGFVNGDTVAAVTGAAALTTTATTDSDIGSYPITPAVGSLAATNYSFATFNPGTLTVTAAGISVALDGLSQTYDGQPKSVTVTTTPSGLATTVTYGIGATPPTNAGSYAVSAHATSTNYSGTAQGTLVIAKAAQTVTFTAPGEVHVGLPITLAATASSGLPVTFSIVSGSATVTGSQLTVADNGTVVVRATQAGDDNYLSATKDVTLANATLATQTITFDQPAAHSTTNAPFALVATASSGLPVTFTYVSGPATLNGGTLTLNNTAGTVVIRASQAGNASYAPADDVTRSITINAKGPQVFFGGFGGQGAKDVTPQAIAVGGGLAANLAPDGEDSTLIGYLPDSAGAFVLKFRLAADGSFSATTTSIPDPTASPVSIGGPAGHPTSAATLAGTTLTFHGQVGGGLLTGTIDELSQSFSAAIQPDTGATATLAGFYQAAPLNSSSGNIYSIVSADGGAFVLAVTPAYVGGGTGTVDTSGSFTVNTPQSGVVAGSVDAASTSVTGTLTLPSQPVQNFAGLGTGTTRTDRLVNLSSRARITPNSGDSTLITGFVIGGTDPKQVLLRGVGPALANYGVQNPAAAPQLRVFDGSGHLIAQNSGWNNDAALSTLAANLGAAPFASGSMDAAVALTLAPGAYSMHVFTAGTAGVALAEIYDADTTPAYQRLLNISTRGPVSSGEGVLIAGFVVTGNSPKRVLIRGAGPGLAQSNVSGVLADPVVRLYDRTGAVIALNDNWETSVTAGTAQTAATAAEISTANTQVGAFAFAAGSKDAALIVVLAPGIYSAQVGSVTNGSGNALVEVYEIP